MATVMEEIICLLKNANFEEPSEVGVCLLTKSEACREQYTLPRRTRSRTVIGPMEEFFIFHIRTESGIDVKVRSTASPEANVYAKVCANAVQNRRHIAASGEFKEMFVSEDETPFSAMKLQQNASCN